MFSPSVSLPLIDWSGSGLYASNCFTMRAVRASYALRSSAVHQFLRLPSASYWLPESSKPCDISCPITTPMPP